VVDNGSEFRVEHEKPLCPSLAFAPSSDSHHVKFGSNVILAWGTATTPSNCIITVSYGVTFSTNPSCTVTTKDNGAMPWMTGANGPGVSSFSPGFYNAAGACGSLQFWYVCIGA
jgi:hypothetical protein